MSGTSGTQSLAIHWHGCSGKAGYGLEVQYYVNDMGRQIAIVVWGFENLDSTPLEGEKEDAHIARVYIAANREIERDPAITLQVNTLMQLVENGDPPTVKKFRREVSRCLDGFRVTMKDLNVVHDRFVWESDFIRNGYTDRIIAKLRKLPQARNEETLALDLSEFGFENKYVIRRSDGTSVYAARDLAFHAWKAANFDRVIDVLGADHKLIAAQLQCTMKLLGDKAPEIVHFEFVSLPEGSMSTRAGKFVSADDLIMEIRKRAFDEVTIRRPELDEETRSSIAKSVGLAAIRYDIVKVTPEKSTVFDWNEALDFERQSGPYIQYAHARACSILEKAGTFTECYDLESEQEIALAKQIAKFPSVIEKIAAETPPSHTCHLFPRTCGYLQYLLSFRTGPEKRGEDPESPAYAGEGGAEHLERSSRNAGNRCHQHHVTPCAGRVTSFFQRRHQQRSSPVCGAKGHLPAGICATSTSSTGLQATVVSR